jgi:uncharacterized protein YjiS (DUF1127 family)
MIIHQPGTLFSRAADRVTTWRRRMRERAALAAFGERDLRDLGLTRLDVLAEAAKPFWRD